MSFPEMQYRSLGNCGTSVSAFGLGGWLSFGHEIKHEATARKMIKTAFDAGINFFDTADVYAKGEAERVMGQLLEQFPRHELVISSKVFFPISADINDRGLSRKHIMESIDKSLQRLGVDYLDIYFCHRPDPNTPAEETARAMDDLVHRGKVLYWGTSEWSGDQLRQVNELGRQMNLYRPQVEQPEYSLLRRRKFEKDVLPALADEGMGAVIWSPLGMGLLTGKYDQGLPQHSRMAKEEWLQEGRYTDEAIARVREFKGPGDELSCSRTQLALAWALNRPGVSSVILGISRLEQLEENLQTLSVEITPQINEQLEKLFPV